MKKLKLDHVPAQLVLSGKKRSTWRLFDDKDLSVNDEVLLIDKVDPDDPTSWKPIGTALIDQIIQKRFGDISDADMEGHEKFASQDSMIATYRRRYGTDVTLRTPVKIIRFSFTGKMPPVVPTEILPRVDKAVVYADGGSRGNPGPSACGYVIYDDKKTMLVYRGVYMGITTNNQAEYTALKLALEEAKNLGAQEVNVYMDSLLVVNQMKGVFKIKNRDLWPIHDTAKRLASQFRRITFTQIPREMNKLADAAVNQALDHQLHAPSGVAPVAKGE